MPRTTSILVSGICDVDPADDLEPFIETANEMVTEHLTDLLDDARLEKVERWLAAHFYCILRPRAMSESAGPVSETIESRVDLGLNVTRYGQMAMVLDSTGTLKALNNTKGKKTVGIDWLGTVCE